MTEFKKWIRIYWTAFIPVIILILVGLNQLRLVNVGHLTHWKGGGFGMFAEITDRFIHIHLVKNRGGYQCTTHPRQFRSTISRLLKYPEPFRLERLVKDIKKGTWVHESRGKKSRIRMLDKRSSLSRQSKVVDFDSVEIQIRETYKHQYILP